MVIFKRKTVPKGCKSKDVIISANEYSDVIKFWLENVWQKRKMAFFNPKSLLMLDSCRAHITPEIKTIVNKYSKMAVNENCVRNGFIKARGDEAASGDSDYVHDDTFSEMEAEEIPKEILNALDSFNVESDEESLGFE